MSKYRKLPVIIDAIQWLKNGDHPQDDCKQFGSSSNGENYPQMYLTEGKVVRYFRYPDMSGEAIEI